MKTTSLLALPLLTLLIAGCSDKSPKADSSQSTEPTLTQKADAAATHVKDAAVSAKDAIANKLVEWKLTPADIKADLEKSGRVVREKTLAAGEKAGEAIDSARVVTVINGKYVADKDLSARKIDVDADQGVVTLTGTVKSDALVGRAIELALDTDGVTRVISLLKVEPSETSVPSTPAPTPVPDTSSDTPSTM